MKMSFIEFILLIGAACIQGVLLPTSIISYTRYKTKTAIMMIIGSTLMLISSVILAMVRPDVPGRIKPSHFQEGYVQLKAQLSWMYGLLYGGIALFIMATVWLVISVKKQQAR